MSPIKFIVSVAIIVAVNLLPSNVVAKANFDSVLVYHPQAKWIDQQGTLSWKVGIINGTSNTAYFDLFVRLLDTAGFELTHTGRVMEKQPPQSIREYKGTFIVIPKYLSQFGSIEFDIEKDEYSTRMAEAARTRRTSSR